ncbi:MAG: hypothetical protein ACI4QR_01625, partial [Eubacteriales bacterium]
MANTDENMNSVGDINTSADDLLRRLNEQYRSDKAFEEMKKTNSGIDIGDTANLQSSSEEDGEQAQIDMRTLSDDEFKELFDNYLMSSKIETEMTEEDYKDLHKHVINLQQKSGVKVVSEEEPAESLSESSKEEPAYEEESYSEEVSEKPKKRSIFAKLKALMNYGKRDEEPYGEENPDFAAAANTAMIRNTSTELDVGNIDDGTYTNYYEVKEPSGEEISSSEEDISPTEEILENHVDDTGILSSFEPHISEEPEEETDSMMTDTAMMKAFGIDPKNGTEKDIPKDIFEQTAYNTVEEPSFETDEEISPISDPYAQEEASEEKQAQDENAPPRDYVSFEQNKSIFAQYRRKYTSLRIRMIVCAAIAALLLVIENIGIFGISLPSFMQYSAGYAAVEWALIFACALLVCDRMVFAAKRLSKFEMNADTLTLMTFLLSVITSVAALFAGEDEIKMFGFPFAVCVMFNLISAYISVRKEIYTFKILSSSKKKFALTLSDNGKDSPEAAEFSEYLSEDSELYKVVKTDFADGYFARKKEAPASNKKLRVIFPVIFGISVLFAILSAVIADTGVYESFANGYVTFLMCAPVAVFLANELPMYLSSMRAYSNSSAILGDVAPEMLENMSVITFSDEDIFREDGVRIKGVKVIGNNKIENIIYYASSAFSLVGGPLERLFRNATLDSVVSKDVELRVLSDNGIDATVDGKHIVIGVPGYMDAQCFHTI